MPIRLVDEEKEMGKKATAGPLRQRFLSEPRHLLVTVGSLESLDKFDGSLIGIPCVGIQFQRLLIELA